jgi:hypothetical protein
VAIILGQDCNTQAASKLARPVFQFSDVRDGDAVFVHDLHPEGMLSGKISELVAILAANFDGVSIVGIVRLGNQIKFLAWQTLPDDGLPVGAISVLVKDAMHAQEEMTLLQCHGHG